TAKPLDNSRPGYGVPGEGNTAVGDARAAEGLDRSIAIRLEGVVDDDGRIERSVGRSREADTQLSGRVDEKVSHERVLPAARVQNAEIKGTAIRKPGLGHVDRGPHPAC